MIPFILVLFFILFFCIYYLYRLYLKNELKNKISKIINIDNSTFAEEVLCIQSELGIEEKYKISSQKEIEYAGNILKCFSEHLISKFWNNTLSLNHKLIILSDKEYFMLMLRNFLKENELDENLTFFKKLHLDMYDIELICYNENSCENYIYTLTDFSIVYQKIFLYSSLFCEINKAIIKIFPTISHYKCSETIKETLNKGKIEVMRR